MLFLSEKEDREWAALGRSAMAGSLLPQDAMKQIRRSLRHQFCFYVGSLLAAHGQVIEGKRWLRRGAEGEPVPMNTYFHDYLERQGDRLTAVEPVFADPRPYVHFSSLPPLQQARRNFIRHSAVSLPRFDRPLRFLDLGCGDGALTKDLLAELRRSGLTDEIAEICLADPSSAMLDLARTKLSAAFPDARIVTIHARAEQALVELPSACDVVMSSLAWHHMPFETKGLLAEKLSQVTEHVLLFEIEGNHDTPELDSPALAVSLYQMYGGAIAFVLAHPAPPEVIQICADVFLIGELISVLTQPRGMRSEHHMLRRQWIELFERGLGTRFECRADQTCYCDGTVELYMLHYGRR